MAGSGAVREESSTAEVVGQHPVRLRLLRLVPLSARVDREPGQGLRTAAGSELRDAIDCDCRTGAAKPANLAAGLLCGRPQAAYMSRICASRRSVTRRNPARSSS